MGQSKFIFISYVVLLCDKIILIEFVIALHHNFVILPEGYTGIKVHFCRLRWN